GSIAEPLILNGPGVANGGALLNVGGTNTWAGTVRLDSDATLGAASGTTLTITGTVSDLGAGHNLTKEGQGKVILAAANSYRGLTTVNDGTLTVENPLALGASGTSLNATVVNKSLTKAGTLELLDPAGTGFTVLDELLTLNGPGTAGLGALSNAR